MLSDTLIQNLYNVVDWTPAISMTPAVQAWHSQKANYKRWWDIASGNALMMTDKKASDDPTGEPAYLWPLHVNPIEWIVSRHTGALFGDVPDQADTPVEISYTNAERMEDDNCKILTDLQSAIWLDSNGRETMLAGASVNQTHGGHFIKPTWDPTNSMLTHGIKFQSLIPDFVVPIYDTTDYWNLNEAWIMYYITPEEARDRFNLKNMAGPRVLYAEHWTKDYYEIQVGGMIPTFKVGASEFTGEKKKNPWGFVPLVYVPHPPRVGTFYGAGHIDAIWGLIKELNRRLADYGDYIQQGSHMVPWARNLSKINFRDVGSGIKVLDAGQKSMASGGEPHMDTLDLPVIGTGAHNVFIERLLDLIDRSASLTSVAYGEDEGSQRSGVTLATRMWPLQQHIKNERMMWTTALRTLHKMTLKMLLTEGGRTARPKSRVNEDMLNLRGQIGWFSMLPLDRQALVDEVVQRAGVDMISPEQGVELLSDGGDNAEEVKRIYDFMQFQSDLKVAEAKATAEAKQSAQPAASAAPKK